MKCNTIPELCTGSLSLCDSNSRTVILHTSCPSEPSCKSSPVRFSSRKRKAKRKAPASWYSEWTPIVSLQTAYAVFLKRSSSRLLSQVLQQDDRGSLGGLSYMAPQTL